MMNSFFDFVGKILHFFFKPIRLDLALILLSGIFSSGCLSPDRHDFFRLPLLDLAGNPVTLESASGKPLMLTFWATWCRDCREEMPTLAPHAQRLHELGYELVFVSSESPETIRRFVERYGYPFQFLRMEKNYKSLGIFSIPYTFVFSSEGKIIFKTDGGIDWGKPENLEILIQNGKADSNRP